MTLGRFATLFCLTTAYLCAGCAPVNTAPTNRPASSVVEENATAINAARIRARTLLAANQLPGISIAVAVQGRIAWAEGFGWSNAEQGLPVTPRTQFRVGSISKSISSAAAGILVERGGLDLDAPVQKYVPAFPAKPWPITTRDLLTNTSGIRHYRDEAEVVSMQHCDNALDGLSIFARDSLLFPPGTRYSYSSYGYTLVSAVVQSAAAKPFSNFVADEVLKPLAMDRTVLESLDRDEGDRSAFYVRSDHSYSSAPPIDTSCLLGTGGYLSTPSDLIRFGLGLLNGTILTKPTVNMLWTPPVLPSGERTSYAMGWIVRDLILPGGVSTPMIFNGGSSIGGRAALVVLPERGVVVAVATNLNAGSDLFAFSAEVAELFLGRTLGF